MYYIFSLLNARDDTQLCENPDIAKLFPIRETEYNLLAIMDLGGFENKVSPVRFDF